MDYTIILIIVFSISIASALLIAGKITSVMAARESKHTTLIGVLSFIAALMLILFILAAFFLSSMDFGR